MTVPAATEVGCSCVCPVDLDKRGHDALLALPASGVADTPRTAGAMALATCWRITRLDGTILRYTDAATPLVIGSETFAVSTGMAASAVEKQAGLKDETVTLDGVISSADITDDDLRAGHYNGAQIDRLLVDWRAPWAGALRESSYLVESVQWDGLTWKAEVTGLTARLRQPSGDVYGRTCRHQLGDAHCGVDLTSASYRQTGRAVATVVTSRLAFTSDIATGNGDQFYRAGKLVWLTGSNAGVVSEVASYTETGGAVTLRLATPAAITASDTFDIYAGCDKLHATCASTFSNGAAFGGFPYIPGTDQALRTPEPR